MELIALKKLTYGGTRYFAGDRFSTRSKDGKALVFLRKAIIAPNFATQTLPEVELEFEYDELKSEDLDTPIEPPRVKRTYKRRDMVAEK